MFFESPRPPDIEANLMVIDAKVDGSLCPVLIDSGASHCFVSQNLVGKLNLPIEPFHRSIQLAAGKNGTTLGIIRALEFKLGNMNDKEDFIVIPENNGRLILGMTWLRRVNPAIDWRSGEIRANFAHVLSSSTSDWINTSLDHPAHDIHADSSTKMSQSCLATSESNNDSLKVLPIGSANLSLENMVISRKQASRLIRKKKAGGIWVFVKVMEESGQLKVHDQNVRKLLDKYHDVFPEELPGPPPERVLKHEIKTVDKIPIAKQM